MTERQGQFVWYDLLTTDVNGAARFYKEVIGWTTQPFEASNGAYSIWHMGQMPLGGVTALRDDAKKAGATPHWMAHVAVADVDTLTRKTESLGAKTVAPPQDIPTVGRFSVIADPQGAIIALFTPKDGLPPAAPDDTHGHMTWRELVTTDTDAAMRFYGDVFGWEQVDTFDMGAMGTYVIYGKGGQAIGGMMNKPDDYPWPPNFLYYTHVDDLDAAVGRTKASGGQVLNGPMPIPGDSRIAQCLDPQGAPFALHGK